MNFDNPKVYGNTSIFDGLVFTRDKAAVNFNFIEKKWGPRETHRWRCVLGLSLSKASREFKKLIENTLSYSVFEILTFSERYRLVCSLLVEQFISLDDWKILTIYSFHI